MDLRLRIFLCSVLCLCVLHILISGPGPPEGYDDLSHMALGPNNSFVYPVASLPPDDYKRLIDMSNFTFKIITKVCNDSYPLLLILVHSAPKNFIKRMTIRETWGQKIDNVKLLFMLGTTNESIQQALDAESKKYGDFVQGNFKDAYRNVTYKHSMVFKYAIYHCPHAKYVLKADDDIFVNVKPLVEFLHNISAYGATGLLMCNVQSGATAIRSYRSKWRVSIKEYPYRRYPAYCPGWSMLYSNDVLFKLYKELQSNPYFWIDDVLISGILMKRLNLTQTTNANYMATKNEQYQILHEFDTAVSTNPPFLFAQPELNDRSIRILWNFTEKYAKSEKATHT